MSTTQSDANLLELLGFTDLPEEEQQSLIEEIGATIMESAYFRFLTQTDEQAVGALTQALDRLDVEQPETLKKLLMDFPVFSACLEEEVKVFKEDALQLLGNR